MFGLKVLYLTFSQRERKLQVDFTPGSSFKISDDNYDTKVVEVFGVDHKQGLFGTTFDSPRGGQAKLLLRSYYNRSEIDPDTIFVSSDGLERHLKETKAFNYCHEVVQQTAREICSQLPLQHKNNPYAQMEGIVSWITDNVKGVPVSSEYLDKMEVIIKRGEWTPAEVLAVVLKDEHATRIGEKIEISTHKKEAREIAKSLVYQAQKIEFVYGWGDSTTKSASTTIDRKEGNCQGMTNIYIALARYLGIPSKEVGGYVKVGDGGGHHAWAVSHLLPYGWVEVDPTLGKTKDFPFQNYGYNLAREFKGENPLPSFSLEYP